MIILAKQGTELENVLKGFYVQFEKEREEVPVMIEKFTGVRPSDFGYYWVFGITAIWATDVWQFDNTAKPKNVISHKENGCTYYKPNGRLKVSKEFLNIWKSKFKGIDGKVLSKYGIPIEYRSLCFNWLPKKDGDRYGIQVPSSLLDIMPKIENKQYEIKI